MRLYRGELWGWEKKRACFSVIFTCAHIFLHQTMFWLSNKITCRGFFLALQRLSVAWNGLKGQIYDDWLCRLRFILIHNTERSMKTTISEQNVWRGGKRREGGVGGLRDPLSEHSERLHKLFEPVRTTETNQFKYSTHSHYRTFQPLWAQWSHLSLFIHSLVVIDNYHYAKGEARSR